MYNINFKARIDNYGTPTTFERAPVLIPTFKQPVANSHVVDDDDNHNKCVVKSTLIRDDIF